MISRKKILKPAITIIGNSNVRGLAVELNKRYENANPWCKFKFNKY